MVGVDAPAGRSSPDGKTIALVTDAPNPADSTSCCSSSTLRPRSCRPRRGHENRRRSATRTRSGGRTAWSCSTPRTAATGHAARAVIMRYDTRDKKARAADGRRLHAAVVFARRPVHRGDADDALGHGRRDPRRAQRPRAPAGHRRRRLVGAGLVAGRGRRSRSCTSIGPDRRPATRASSTAPRRSWTVAETIDLTEVSGLDAASRPGLVHPGRPAARDRRRRRRTTGGPAARRSSPREPVTATAGEPRPYLERLAARSTRDRARSCASGSIRTRRRCRLASRRTCAGVERFAASARGGRARTPRAVKPNLAFFEAYGSAGLAALERLRARDPGRRAGRSPTRSAATSGRPPRGRPSRCSTSSVPMRSRSTRTSARRRSRRCSSALDRFAYVLCRTSNPGAGELQDLASPRTPRPGAPAEPLHERVARLATGWGPGGTVGLVVGRDRAR